MLLAGVICRGKVLAEIVYLTSIIRAGLAEALRLVTRRNGQGYLKDSKGRLSSVFVLVKDTGRKNI